MLVIAAYTASLAAIFLAMKPSVKTLPFATFDELSKQNEVRLLSLPFPFFFTVLFFFFFKC